MRLYDPSPLLPVPSHLCCNSDVCIPDFQIFLNVVYLCFWLDFSSDVAVQHFS